MEGSNELQKLSRLTKDNLARSEEILAIAKDIKKYIRLTQIWTTFRLFLILVPIVLGLIYLPPLVKDAINFYKTIFVQ
jgi:hypothetical protein